MGLSDNCVFVCFLIKKKEQLDAELNSRKLFLFQALNVIQLLMEKGINPGLFVFLLFYFHQLV